MLTRKQGRFRRHLKATRRKTRTDVVEFEQTAMSDSTASNVRARKTNGAANGNGSGNGHAAAAAVPVTTVRAGLIPTEYGKLMDKKLDVHQT